MFTIHPPWIIIAQKYLLKIKADQQNFAFFAG